MIPQFALTNTKIKDTYVKVLQVSSSDNIVRTGLGDPVTTLAVSGTLISSNLTVVNNIVAGGAIYAESLVVSTVSYISGSTIFGSSSFDTHQFTGSVFISGNLNVSGLINNVDITNLNSSVSTSLTALYYTASNHEGRIAFLESESFASGNLWIQTDSSSMKSALPNVVISGSMYVTNMVYATSSYALTASFIDGGIY